MAKTDTNTTITIEHINASLGRNEFYGPRDKVRLSYSGQGELLTVCNGHRITINEAFTLIANGKVWGMNVCAEDLLKAALEAQEAIKAASSIHSKEKQNNALNGLNVRNLQNLVSDGSIFYVDFTKRTTGERRLMRCRTGVKKHLKGGDKAYSTKAKNLLTVFDMNAKGYRSIPVDAIQTLTVNGQNFNFAGV